MSFTSGEKAFCVLEYARTQSIKTVRRIFAQRFERSAFGKVPDKKQTWRWHKKFSEEGCLGRVEGSGRKSMSEETVDKIRQKIVNSPKKSIRRTSFETHNSLACYTETITNEALQTATDMGFFGLFTIFWRILSTVSSDIDFRPDPSTLPKQPSSLNFLCHL